MPTDPVPQPPRAARRQAGPPGEPKNVGYLYALPALLVFSLFFIAPMLHGVWLSLFEWDGLGVGTWVGLDNYGAVLTDPELRAPFVHALVLVFFFSAVPLTLGLILAALMMRARLRGAGFFRSIVFLPQVVALTVVAVAWRAILAPDGPLNELLRAAGLGGLTRGWLGDETWALPAVGLVGIWVGTGLCTILFVAGLSKVSRELYEAARLDGAGPVREFFAVSLPALRSEIAVAATLTIVAALKTFDLVYVMTGGGPARSTTVPSFEVYDRAMLKGEVGTGVTLALMLSVVILAATIIVNKLAERES